MADAIATPLLRCLKPREWPARHRQAWDEAFADGGLLAEQGPAAGWSPATTRKNANGFGHWLSWCTSQGINTDQPLPAVVIPERVRAYLLDLRPERASLTVTCRAQELYNTCRVMMPDHDWGWLLHIYKAQRARSHPERDKLSRLKAAGELDALGVRLMAEAEAATHWSDQRRAVHYRDGLMIVLLIRRLLRLKNFTALRLGDHVVHQDGAWQLRIPRAEMKGKRPLRALLPQMVADALGRYLDHYRLILLRGDDGEARTHDALWVSEVGTPMADRSIHGRIRKHTTAAFGASIPPHWFRDAGATAYALDAPKQAREIMHLLGHGSPAIAEQHYNHALALDASRRHAELMEALRQSSLPDE